jgi:hypothetical protein
MAAELPEALDKNQPGEYEHGPEPAQRTPRSEYTEEFLRGLQVTGKVRPVSDDWDRNSLDFPPNVNWVIYPNGDLERIGFD